LSRLMAERWPLVICDEFQDTDDGQWDILSTLGKRARLLLLADPNQMIYTFLWKRGVGARRLEDAQTEAGRVVELERRSHRDPSGAIPAMAEAVRLRRFRDEAVLEAVRSGRLVVRGNVDDEALRSVLREEIDRVQGDGARSVGVFGHSNEGVATLSLALYEIDIDHVLVGIGEAHAKALGALATLCGYGVGLRTSADIRVSLATFLTACTRGTRPPPLAVLLAAGSPLPTVLEGRLRELGLALKQAKDGPIADLVAVAYTGWQAIGILGGVRPWRQACLDFGALIRQVASFPSKETAVAALVDLAERRRPAVLVEFDVTKIGPIQLMNFHQTKGREADAVILVYRSGDYLANRSDSEPYEESSRVLFVSLTRARNQAVVVLPRDPHLLVAPFEGLAR
jgi:DNA helicase-2/ATP-dependent DNA helicase PcrA